MLVAKGTGCDLFTRKFSITGIEKRELGEWGAPLEICYRDIEDTIGKNGMKGGNGQGADFRHSVLDLVLIPLLKRA
jgi:hypothetical protein